MASIQSHTSLPNGVEIQSDSQFRLSRPISLNSQRLINAAMMCDAVFLQKLLFFYHMNTDSLNRLDQGALFNAYSIAYNYSFNSVDKPPIAFKCLKIIYKIILLKQHYKRRPRLSTKSSFRQAHCYNIYREHMMYMTNGAFVDIWKEKNPEKVKKFWKDFSYLTKFV